MIALMLVPMAVWVTVWGYLYAIDRRVKRLEVELNRREAEEAR